MSVAEKTERKVVTPDVYGNTPFQHEVTAEPTNTVAVVVRPAKAVGYWHRTANTVARIPALPKWMVVSKPSR
jgi:hypothetical protein